MNCDMFNQLNINETKKDPLISIIIPVYNVAPYIREALDSAVNQSYKNLEIISIDDGATDESGQICDEYKTDPRLTVIHQKHQGPGKARNTGLDIATGEYIAFLDPDDAYHPDFIQLMLGAIEDADIIECQHEVHQLTLKSKGEPGLSKVIVKSSAVPDKKHRFFSGAYNIPQEDCLTMAASHPMLRNLYFLFHPFELVTL